MAFKPINQIMALHCLKVSKSIFCAYNNSKLFAGVYKVWVTGAFLSVSPSSSPCSSLFQSHSAQFCLIFSVQNSLPLILACLMPSLPSAVCLRPTSSEAPFLIIQWQNHP